MSEIKEQIITELDDQGVERKFLIKYRIEEHDSAGLPDGLSWVTTLSKEEIKDEPNI